MTEKSKSAILAFFHLLYGKGQAGIPIENNFEKEFEYLESWLKVYEADNNQPRIDDGELWSAIRDLLIQGGAIETDYRNGKYKGYEELSARLDCAARERVDWLKKKIFKEPII